MNPLSRFMHTFGDANVRDEAGTVVFSTSSGFSLIFDSPTSFPRSTRPCAWIRSRSRHTRFSHPWQENQPKPFARFASTSHIVFIADEQQLFWPVNKIVV